MAKEPDLSTSTEIMALMFAGVMAIHSKAGRHPKSREIGSAVLNYFPLHLAELCNHLGVDPKEMLALANDYKHFVDPFATGGRRDEAPEMEPEGSLF